MHFCSLSPADWPVDGTVPGAEHPHQFQLQPDQHFGWPIHHPPVEHWRAAPWHCVHREWDPGGWGPPLASYDRSSGSGDQETRMRPALVKRLSGIMFLCYIYSSKRLFITKIVLLLAQCVINPAKYCTPMYITFYETDSHLRIYWDFFF